MIIATQKLYKFNSWYHAKISGCEKYTSLKDLWATERKKNRKKVLLNATSSRAKSFTGQDSDNQKNSVRAELTSLESCDLIDYL